jgi:hypothetical protein
MGRLGEVAVRRGGGQRAEAGLHVGGCLPAPNSRVKARLAGVARVS